MSTEYKSVVNRIYLPKVEFLFEVLSSRSEIDVTKLNVLDFGCGSGHFVSALREYGFQNSYGVDSLKRAVDEAHAHGLSESVTLVEVDAIEALLGTCRADLVSMMCVLPHLREPKKSNRIDEKCGGKVDLSETTYVVVRSPFRSFPTII